MAAKGCLCSRGERLLRYVICSCDVETVVILSTVILEECQNGQLKVALQLPRPVFSELALEECFSIQWQESSTTLHLIPGSSDLNSHVCAHTMLKLWRTQKWLLWPSSLKVLIVKETPCSSKDLTLVRIHWQWFGTLTIMLVEMAC